MAKKVINAFNAGEVSPYVYARQDSKLYDKACLKMENFLPLEYGGATKRPASKFVHEFTTTSSNPISNSKLYSFIYNTEETFILAFTNYNLDIFKNNELITSLTTPYPNEALNKLKFVQSNDILFISSEDYPIQTLRRYSSKTSDDVYFELEELNYKFPPVGDKISNDIIFSASAPKGEATVSTNSSYFRQTDVGSFLVLEQKRDLLNSAVSEEKESGVTDSINVSFTNYEVETTGSKWAGKVIVEKSTDGGDSFELEFTLIDTGASKTTDGGEVSANFCNRSFASTEAEGANTFIRLRFLPSDANFAEITAGDGHIGKAGMRIKVNDPFVKGLFKIEKVGSSTSEEVSTQASGTWISPIQDVDDTYSASEWQGGNAYQRRDKILFAGEVTVDPDFDGANNAFRAFPNITNNTNIQQKYIDMTMSYFTEVNNINTPYLYMLTNDNKIARYIYSYSNGAMAEAGVMTITMSEPYVGAASGRGTEVNQTFFGIASNQGRIYVLGRTDPDANRGLIKIMSFAESSFSDGTTLTLTDQLYKQSFGTFTHVFNLHGLGFGNGHFYFKSVVRFRPKDGRYQQQVTRHKVDLSGNVENFVTSSSIPYGKSPKTTANGTFKPKFHELCEEPADDTITDPKVMVRDQIDNIYLNGYLVTLNDRVNKLDFLTTSFGNTGLSKILTDPDNSNNTLAKSFFGLAVSPKFINLNTNPLTIGNKYRVLVGSDATTAHADSLENLQKVGFPLSATTSDIVNGVSFIATNTGSGESDITFTTPTGNGAVYLIIDATYLENARDTDVDVLIAYKDQDSNGRPTVNNPRLSRMTFNGEPNFYQATRDFDTSTSLDGSPSYSRNDVFSSNGVNRTFNDQLSRGLWVRTFPKIVKATESAYSGHNGYPNSIAIFENRLCLGGNTKFPNRLWMSKTDDLNNFILGSFATDALDLQFNSLTQDEITWLCAGRELNIGTVSSEWTLGSGNQSLPVTATQLNLKRRSEYGSSNLQGTLVNSAILFLMRQGKKLREWYLRDNQNDYLAQDLSAIAEHITGEGIVDIAVQNQPTTTIWLVREDGDLVSLTYERETDTFAWAKHTFDGEVESVSVIPNENGEDKVYLIIKKASTTLTKDNVAIFNITITSSRKDQTGGSATEGQEIDITADGSKFNSPRFVHNSGEASAIVLPVGQTNTSPANDSNVATPRVNAFVTGGTTSHADYLYNVGSPETNPNFVKTVQFDEGEVAGLDIFVWNKETGSSAKDGNDVFVDYEGDPTITINNTIETNTQTQIQFTYDTGGEYNFNIYIGDASESTEQIGSTVYRAAETANVKLRNATPALVADNRILVELDPIKHESAYKQKYSGLDFYVRQRNFTGSSFTGLDHLEGKTVTYKVNGGTAQTTTVNSGAINVGSQASANVIAGIPFTSTLAPLYVDADQSIGNKKSVSHATIRFKDTLEAKVGQKETGTFGENSVSVLDDVKFSSSNSLNTEDAEVWLANHNEFLQTIYVVSDTPQPCTVLAMVVDVEGV